jgi:hypothetical protein
MSEQERRAMAVDLAIKAIAQLATKPGTPAAMRQAVQELARAIDGFLIGRAEGA